MSSTAERRGDRRAIARFLVGLVALFPLVNGMTLCMVAASSSLAGWRPVVVTSGSMAPGIRPGDIVLAGKARDVATGSIAVFATSGSGNVTHRVIARNADGTYTTRGDANEAADSTPVRADEIVGTAKLILPFVGRPLLWLAARDWSQVGVFAVALLVAIAMSRYALLAEHDPWAERRGVNAPAVARRRSVARRAGGVAVAIVLIGGWISATPARAAFSNQSSRSSAMVAASSFCPTKTPTFMAGFDRGGSAFPGTFDGGSVTAASFTVDSGGRDGSGGLAIAKLAGGAGYVYRVPPATPAAVVARFALSFDALPAADVSSLAAVYPAAGNGLSLGYQRATNRLTLAFGGGSPAISSVTVAAGAWYVVELQVAFGADPRVAEWRVDGAAQPSVAGAEAASTVTAWLFGSGSSTDVYAIHVDDLLLSTTPADYPLGDGRVRTMLPASMGASVGADKFLDDDGTAVDAASHLRLDDIPQSTTTDFVKQVSAGATSYLEVGMTDVSQTCINGVLGIVTYHSLGNPANNAKAAVYSGTRETVLVAGDMSEQSLQLARAMVTPATTWSQSAVNALVARLGYGSDVSPVPAWDSVVFEYDAAY